MKRFLLFLTAFFTVYGLCAQQQILLLTESFESGGGSFVLNGAGVGTNSGANQWTINADYDGQPTYPNTPPQDSIVSGQINGAPNSSYLHIYDSNAGAGIANANWNPSAASDHFTYLGSPFCTLGMSDVIFTFFWLCEGDANAYGEVYYSIDGGPWVKTGQTKYNNQSKWKYEIIQDPAFNNVQNLQLGFRWVNPAAGTANVSFSIDDIIAVGTYDNVNNPVHLSITQLFSDSVCQDNYIFFSYELSAPLCDGQYQIELSDANGNFANPINEGVVTISAPDTTGVTGFKVPNNVVGNCFRIRLNRISPEPQIIGDTSVCFTILDCPESVFTLNAPVMNDNDTTCILSVIDVKFNSIGVFGINNHYIAELSDANGSFANPYQLGNNPDNQSYPGFPPGNVSGLIPQNVPPGCGYYIRVRSTSPAIIGTVIGPFCLVQCDELTNNHTDIHFCIQSGPFPPCSTIVVHPNQWSGQASYDTCNNWTIELHDMMTFGLVNSGGLGVYHDSIGGNFTLCMPGTADSLPVAPGTYYMRMVSNCSNLPWNQTGSVIRITIGAPQVNPPQIITDDTVYCNLGFVNLSVVPFLHPPSDYEWACNGLNNGNPFVWPYNPLIVDFTNAPLNDYIFYVREINFGCYGPYSSSKGITIIGEPDVTISGPQQVCLGDTVTYNVGYLKKTYYNWDAPSGVKILEEGNSQTTVIFDTLGTFTLSNFSLNACGSDSDFYSVKVVTLYSADAGPDQSICEGKNVDLSVQSTPVDKLFITSDTATSGKQGAMFNIIAHYDVKIDSIAAKFLSTQPVIAEIYSKQGSYRTFEQDQLSWNQVGAYFNFPPNPIGQMTVIPIEINQQIAANDTVAFYVTTANTSPVINMASGPGTGVQQGVVYKTDGVIDFVQGTSNAYPFGTFTGPRVLNCKIYYSTKAGLHYVWNTGDTTTTIQVSPQQTTLYSVIVYDTSGCKNRDSVLVKVNTTPTVNAGPDTLICDGENYQMQATSSIQTVVWNPATGLSNAGILNPVFNNSESVEYILIAIDTTGCGSSDTVKIDVHNCNAYIEVPQAFTPNGDGVNDFFTLFGNNIADYEIRIYNRWGELVYTSTDVGALNDLGKGWDGTYKGKEQNLGTYVYYLTAKDTYGKSYEKKGNLTLIR